jgi:hypothetical protein
MDLSQLRITASCYGAEEIYFNDVSKIISFQIEYARVNVYYSTATVGTCLDHPVTGKTQLFRRNQTISMMASIFEDPRVHTGVGYFKSKSKKRKVKDNPYVVIDEEEALKEQLESLSEISDGIKAQQKLISDALQILDIRRELQEKNLLLLKEDEAKVAERNRQTFLKQQRRNSYIANARIQFRGTRWGGSFEKIDRDFVMDHMVHDTVSCVAMSGSGVLMLYDDGRFSSCGNIPMQLFNTLHKREKSLPKPEFVALGSHDTYYVRYTDGHAEWSWSGIDNDDFNSFVRQSQIDKVAFSANNGWFVSTKRGGFSMSGKP